MTGCDKIVEEILEEARQAVRTKLDTAEQKAAAVAAEGRRNAQEQAATILAEGLEQEEGIRRAARSAAALRVRNAKLAHRRRELDAAMTATIAYLNALPDVAYFDRLLPVLGRSVQPGAGILRLNARDLARLPADFDSRLRALLKEAGVEGTITVSGVPSAIDGGLLLQYGDVEINAAFSALAEEKREALEDLINRELFADGEDED